MTFYKIKRFYFNGESQVIKTGLTLEEVQKHCDDPETSSKTCKSLSHKEHTKKFGPWFEGYEKE